MTADTFSNTLGFLAMGTGNDNNSWGNNCNTAVFQIFEDAIANFLTSAVTGGTLDLSGSPPPAAASQVRYAALLFTGTLGSNQVVKVPNLTKFWWLNNQTSGAFTLKIQTPSGSASTAIPQNSGWQLVICDGSNNIVVIPFNSKQIQMPDGSAALPAYSDINETNSGWYRHGTQDWRLSINGNDIIQLTGTGAASASIVNVLSPNALQVNGVAVATGNAATVSGTPTTGHVATWASATQLQDGGALGTLSTLNSVKASNLDTAGSTLDQWALTNLSLAVTVGSNLLTVTLNGANGSAPSASNPVLVNFQDSSGNPVLVSVQAATSITTNAVGASLGSSNNVPFRLWVALFNNGGTAVLALINCSSQSVVSTTTMTQTFPCNEYGVASTTAMSAAATSAGVFYTPNGTTLTNAQFRIIGCIDYETALVTAGTYNNAPDTVRLKTPGLKNPGDVVRSISMVNTATSTTSSGSYGTAFSQAISPTSKINLIRADATIGFQTPSANGNATMNAQLVRGSTVIGPPLGGGQSGGGNVAIVGALAFTAVDAPGSLSSQTYALQVKSNAGTLSYGPGSITLAEIMG